MAITENLLYCLRWLHIVTGSLALVTSLLPLVVRKGSAFHNKTGKLFIVSIVVSSLAGTVLGLVKTSPLLFFVGILSCWSALVGRSALKGNGFLAQRRQLHGLLLIAYLLTAIASAGWSYQLSGQVNPVLLAFVSIAFLTSIPEIRHLRKPEINPAKRYGRHAGQIMGAVIASWTAFLVVNETFGLLMLNWFLPTVGGGLVIGYWQNKIKKGWLPLRKATPKS